jgi:hypothetical protein
VTAHVIHPFMVSSNFYIGGRQMHPLAGKKQSPEHVAKRIRAMRRTLKAQPWRKSSGPPKNTAASFWSRVDKRRSQDCWPWLGHTSDFGYGRIDIFGEEGVYTHRVAFFLKYPNRITLREQDGILVLHNCDNPACCNPRHLYVGSHDDNMKDKVKRGRSKWCESSVKSPRAKLTAHDVQQIRLHRANGVTRKALALLYEVSVSTIKGVTSGRHYADIGD